MAACKFYQLPHPSRVSVKKVIRRPFIDLIHCFLGVVRELNRHVLFALRARLHGRTNVLGQGANSLRDKGVLLWAQPNGYGADTSPASDPTRNSAQKAVRQIEVARCGVVLNEFMQAVSR